MANELEDHFILSREGYFWRPGGRGYTGNVFEAGLFTEKYAKHVEHSGRSDRFDKAVHVSERASEIRAGAASAPKLLALVEPAPAAPAGASDAMQALLSLGDWIEKQYRLGDSPKVRLKSAAETIYAEIVSRLAELRSAAPDQGGAKHPPMDGSIASIEELPKAWLGLPVRGVTGHMQFYDATGRRLLRSEVPGAKFPISYRWEKPREGCQANRDGDCSWSACPQDLDGEPQKTGRHCPLDTRGEQ